MNGKIVLKWYSMRPHYYKMLGVLNHLVNRVEERLQRTSLISKPVDIDLVLTKACNFACSFCKDYETPAGSKRISIEEFQTLADQVFPTARRLNICSGGEPYLHNQIIDILKIAKNYGLHTWLLSNGSVFIPKKVEQILEHDLVTQHGFSVDGFKPETVESIRLNGKHKVIVRTIQSLKKMRDEAGKKNPEIIIRYAMMRRNIEELPDAIRFWGDMGVDGLDAGYLSLANEISKDELLYYHQPILEKMLEEAHKVKEQYPNLKVNLPISIRDAQKQTEKQNCNSPWSFAMIDTNGEIMPCYRSFEALRMPSVYEGNKFSEIWNGEQYQKLRASVNNDAEEFYPYCTNCENRCGWGDEKVHLGDETWQEVVKDWLPETGSLNHKRPIEGGYKKNKKSA